MELETTTVLKRLAEGDARAADRLMPVIYNELHGMAERILRSGRGELTLQPTALIHEAYLKLIGPPEVDWRSRTHFVAIAARAMRQIVQDHVRGRLRAKRGGGWTRVTICSVGDGSPRSADTSFVVPIDVVDDAIARLNDLDHRAATVVVLRYFGGLGNDAIAEVLGVTRRTVHNDWDMARAWLRRELAKHAGVDVS